MLKKLYKSLRNKLSPKLQANLTKLVFRYSGKPYYKKDNIPLENKFPNREKGGLIISADFELAWAFRYSKEFEDPAVAALHKAQIARKNFPVLLGLFKKYNIPITWATVGHLLLEECKSVTHEWMHRIQHFENRCWKFSHGDWFDHDPYSNWKKDPEWYAPDLIKSIVDSQVEHEIGMHTFSHIDFSDKICSQQVADDEMKACKNVFNGYEPISMAFPAGTWGNREVLQKYGIKIYRRKIDNLNLAYPFIDKYGLYVTPTTMIFGRNHRQWTSKYYQSRFIKCIDKAIETGTIAHFWLHPSVDSWTLINVLPQVLKYAYDRRQDSELWIGTMGNIYRHINQKGL
ncbi:MAG: polysaccharide deacetylase family protein [Candidatus Marinimicrobia bacterium]|nr:polysaccharide deacetylase family protein [Candidatus Neomarinimicrobiota bacterium]